jgi:Dodecin
MMSGDRPIQHRLWEVIVSGTVARVTEISATSDTSFEDAVNVGVDRANATLRSVKLPTSSPMRTTSTIPTPWPPPSTICWPASHTWRPAEPTGEIGQEPHLRPRVALTLPHFCHNEPVRREHG